MIFETVIGMIASYCIGSLSSAILICKLMHLPDPRTQGSGNPGATNVLRFGGKKAAILTLLGDVLKGFLPVLIARELDLNTLTVALIALAAFLGHLYPVFFKFQGGKGVATAFGCLLGLSWLLGLALAGTWFLIAAAFRYSSLAALVTTLLCPLYTGYFTNLENTIVSIIMGLLLIYRHRQNIKKLVSGAESKIGQKI